MSNGFDEKRFNVRINWVKIMDEVACYSGDKVNKMRRLVADSVYDQVSPMSLDEDNGVVRLHSKRHVKASPKEIWEARAFEVTPPSWITKETKHLSGHIPTFWVVCSLEFGSALVINQEDWSLFEMKQTVVQKAFGVS